MFNGVEDIKALSLQEVVTFAEEHDCAEHLLSEDLKAKYKQSKKEVREMESLIEDLAFAMRERLREAEESDENLTFDSSYYADDMEELISEFMNNVAYDLDLCYNNVWESHPDHFWQPSNC